MRRNGATFVDIKVNQSIQKLAKSVQSVGTFSVILVPNGVVPVKLMTNKAY
jgi:hypothetical protein